MAEAEAAAAAAHAFPPWVMLDSVVRVGVDDPSEHGAEWPLHCEDKQAYTHELEDDDNQEVKGATLVKGMDLFARISAPPGLSSMSVRLSADLLGGNGRRPVLEHYSRICLRLSVKAADEKLIVLTAYIPDVSSCKDSYIVYNGTNKSLSIVRQLSTYCSPSFTPRPLPVHRDDDGGFSLAILATAGAHKYLCLWPPPESSKPLRASMTSNIEPWRVKQPLFPSDLPSTFKADTVFTFKGQAFWADLGQGVLFCNCDDILFGGYDVQFHFVPLPKNCRLEPFFRLDKQPHPATYRTMTCVGDSIKFVSIGDQLNGAVTDCTTLNMWALVPPSKTWKKIHEINMSLLWGQPGFKKAGLPKTKPMHPILSRHQDGVVYLLLPSDDGSGNTKKQQPSDDRKCKTKQQQQPSNGNGSSKTKQQQQQPSNGNGSSSKWWHSDVYLFGFDMSSASFLSSKRVPYPHFICQPTLLGFDCFRYLEEQCILPPDAATASCKAP